MGNSHSNTMFPFSSCVVELGMLELVFPVHETFILLVTQHRESWHCTSHLAWAGAWDCRCLFIISVLWPDRRGRNSLFEICVFRSLMLRWVGARQLKQTRLASCARKRTGDAFENNCFPSRGSTVAGLLFKVIWKRPKRVRNPSTD